MDSATEPRRPQFTPEERERWISRFRSSDLPQARFAEQNGLKLKTLQRWLYGHVAQPATKGKPPVPALKNHSHRINRAAVVTRQKSWRTPSATFREIKLPPLGALSADWAAEVTWPSGVTVRLGVRAEAEWIGALLQVVRQAC